MEFLNELVVCSKTVPGHEHFVCTCTKAIKLYEFGPICAPTKWHLFYEAQLDVEIFVELYDSTLS